MLLFKIFFNENFIIFANNEITNYSKVIEMSCQGITNKLVTTVSSQPALLHLNSYLTHIIDLNKRLFNFRDWNTIFLIILKTGHTKFHISPPIWKREELVIREWSSQSVKVFFLLYRNTWQDLYSLWIKENLQKLTVFDSL